MKLSVSLFRGEVPRVADNHLSDSYAAEAIACKIRNGNLLPFNDLLFEATPTKTGTKKTIYLWNATHSNPGYWFHWTTDVDAVRGPVAGDTQATTYYTGDGVPKKTDSTLATSGGGTNYPTASYDLGVPAPETEATVTAQDVTGNITGATQANPVVITDVGHGRSTGDLVYIESVGGMTEINDTQFTITVLSDDTFSLQDSSGNDIDGTGYTAYTSGGMWTQRYLVTDLETRSYVYTYVSSDQEESAPSPASLTVDVGPGQPVYLEGMDTGPTGSYNVTHKRIYRTATVGGSTDFYFVAEIVAATATYTDSLALASLGEVIPSTDWDMPPSDLAGLTVLDNGMMAGFSKNQVCFSYPYQPHAWPTTYRKTIDYPIVGLKSFGNTVVAVTEENPTVLVGVDPRSMTPAKKKINQGCVSKRGMVSLSDGVAYPSPDGLIVVGITGTRNITESLISRDEWLALVPTSFIACIHNGMYYCFYDDGTNQGMFIIDPNNPENGIVFYDTYATACYADPLSDTLYLQVGSDIEAWDSDSAKITYRWKSKEFLLDDEVTLQAGRVKAKTYADLTMRLYVDGSLIHTETVGSKSAFRMPGGYRGSAVQIELEGTDEVKVVEVAETMSELAEA